MHISSVTPRDRACAETSPARGQRRTTARTRRRATADCTDPEARAGAVELLGSAAESDMTPAQRPCPAGAKPRGPVTILGPSQ
jgi:hypothetical protein